MLILTSHLSLSLSFCILYLDGFETIEDYSQHSLDQETHSPGQGSLYTAIGLRSVYARLGPSSSERNLDPLFLSDMLSQGG